MSDHVRVCLVGGGRVAKVHAHSLTHHIPAATVTGLVEPVRDVLHTVGDQFGIARRWETFEAALEWGKFDAVVITTPTFTHRALAVMAAEAGKHVFLEKPMAITLEECDAIIAAAQLAGVVLQLGFMRRFDPEFVAAYDRIQAGEIGRPMLVKSLTHGPGLPPTWARDLTRSNGMLAEVNSHDWDCVRWLMSANPQRVYAEIANFKGDAHQIDTPHYYDNAIVNIRFENGGLGSISGVCPCEYGYDARVEIIGERGLMQIGDIRGQAVIVAANRNRGYITPIYRTWPERFAWGYIREMEHFIACVQASTPPKASGDDGRWAVAGVLAATRSFLEERPVFLSEVLKTS
jgi:predicted dehydrogenase